MEFLRRAPGVPTHLGILPGTFNPITVAHLALAEAALTRVDEVVFILPRSFPHKPYTGASFDERVAMLAAAVEPHATFSVAAAEGGLFAEIAAECRSAYPSRPALSFLCGRDAAERIVGWDYGDPHAFDAMLQEFSLLVAARSGEYLPPSRWSDSIRTLDLSGPFDHVSATEVRRRIAAGEHWEHLVPDTVRGQVRAIYR